MPEQECYPPHTKNWAQFNFYSFGSENLDTWQMEDIDFFRDKNYWNKIRHAFLREFISINLIGSDVSSAPNEGKTVKICTFAVNKKFFNLLPPRIKWELMRRLLHLTFYKRKVCILRNEPFVFVIPFFLRLNSRSLNSFQKGV